MSCLMLHGVKSIAHQVDHWRVGSPYAYDTHRFELTLQDGSTFSICLFTNDLQMQLQSLPPRVASQEPPIVTECSVCRRDHGPEIVHASE